MCGITGFLQRGGGHAEEMTGIVRAMAGQLRHRGPDDSGEFVDSVSGIALGFRRLAIIDLTPTGHQPMASASGRYVIIFNGEVYNFERIRAELLREGMSAGEFRGHSDTEVILAAVEKWGVRGAVERFVGMFAFALWDRVERRLHLVRDRVGVKPLYYGHSGGAFLFGSELKALRAFPGFDCEIDRDALAAYMRYNYVPAPLSIYRGISKLPPATILTINAIGGVSEERYWEPPRLEKQARHFRGSEAECIDQLDALLRDAVQLRMISDVPLGVFLSGGIDSSTVTALMQAQSSTAVRTFTIGFREESYNEAAHAREVARHLGTEHTELYVTPSETMDVIPRLPQIYDEPFSDASQIPTFLVSQMARRHVTVSLSGDGGDELFGGYNRYFWGRALWRRMRWMPAPARRAAAAVLRGVSPQKWDSLFALAPSRLRQPNSGDKLHKIADILGASSPQETYWRLISHWKNPDALVREAHEPSGAARQTELEAGNDFTEWMMRLDLVTYLPDDILVKVDRASMAVSLEAREPLLDHRLIEFAWSLPLAMKVRDGEGKWALRQVLYRYVPQKLIERPKMGFGIPIDRWLRGPLRQWAESLLDEQRLSREGFFDPAPIRNLWQEHLSERRNWQYHLWDVLMFQAWLEHQGVSRSEPALAS